METMIDSWKKTNGDKRRPRIQTKKMLDMKTLKSKMLNTKVLDENKEDYELLVVENMKKFFKIGLEKKDERTLIKNEDANNQIECQ